MKWPVFLSSLILASSVLVSGIVWAQSTGAGQALRRGDIASAAPVQDNYQQLEGRAVRNYRQQPPIIPHSMMQYQIDLRTNQCLSCHDWTVAGERGAPTLSMTHYLDRDGTQLDSVAGTRWFCNQCHVPQANAPLLVGNDFRPSSDRR